MAERTVTREQVMAACTALGLKPENVASVNIQPFRIRVIEFTRDTNGNRVYNEVLETFDKRAYTLNVDA